MATDPSLGELESYTIIRRWEDLPNNAFGVTPTFDAGKPAWAKLVPSGGAIYLGSMQLNDAVTHQAFMLYTPDINEKTVTGHHVVECDGSRYRVKRANKWRGLKKFLYLELELLGEIAAGESNGSGN